MLTWPDFDRFSISVAISVTCTASMTNMQVDKGRHHQLCPRFLNRLNGTNTVHLKRQMHHFIAQCVATNYMQQGSMNSFLINYWPMCKGPANWNFIRN